MANDDEAFLEWINYVLDYGFDSFSDGNYEPRMFQELPSGQVQISDLLSGREVSPENDVESFLEEGRQHLAQQDEGQLYALIWNESVAGENDEAVDAVFVEAGQRGGSAAILAQAYRRSSSGELSKFGEIRFVQSVQNLWDESAGEQSDDSGNQEAEPAFGTLEELAHEALSYGVKQLAKGERPPFVLLMTDTGECQVGSPEEDDEVSNLEGAVAHGRQYVAACDDGVMYVLVYPGTLTVNGRERDVVIAEAEERDGEALKYAKTYSFLVAEKKAKVGKPFIVSEIPHVWVTENQTS
ncbi:MAG: hypothetical protein V4719_03395 [Planctomycetota bacterium]